MAGIAPSTPQGSRRLPALLVLAAITAVLALLGAVFSVPALKEQAQSRADVAARWQQVASDALAQRLAITLSHGDYGEVQTELDLFAALGQFRTAVVTNERGQVIALLAAPLEVRVGSPAPPDLAAIARQRSLALGRQPLGMLYTLGGPEAADTMTGGIGRSALALAWLAAASALIGAGLLLLRWRRGMAV